MFRTSIYPRMLLAIALGLTAIGSATTPAAAFSGASTKLKPVEVQYGQLPRSQPAPPLRPQRCSLINCMTPARPMQR
jgi:hypothetical protein